MVGMSARAKLKDGIAELLGRDNLSRGVEVKQVEISCLLTYTLLSYGLKFTRLQQCTGKGKYTLEKLKRPKCDASKCACSGS